MRKGCATPLQVTQLPTRAFLAPLREDEEIVIETAPGKAVTIQYKAKGELQQNGKREVFFETFGVPRVLEIDDRKSDASSRVVREKADPSQVGSVGAPMGGDVLEVRPLRPCCSQCSSCPAFTPLATFL